MKMLILALLWVTQTTASAMLFHQPMNDRYSLVAIQSDLEQAQQQGVFSVGYRYQGRSIGITRDLYIGDSWRSGFGVLLSDDSLDVSTHRSMVNIRGRPVDINDFLSIKARLKFSPVTPYFSFGYHYDNEDNLELDIITSLKFFTLAKSDVRFGNELGIVLNGFPQMTNAVDRELNARFDAVYVYPVFDVKLNYRFN